MVPGETEAVAAGKALKESGIKLDLAHTSVLTRAQKTLAAILTESGQTDIPVSKTWRLNERHYGGLTGLNKAETAAKYGEEQVRIPLKTLISVILFLPNPQGQARRKVCTAHIWYLHWGANLLKNRFLQPSVLKKFVTICFC